MRHLILVFTMLLLGQSVFADEYDKENFEIVDVGQKASSHGWYVTYKLDDETFAILAPHHWQETVSFLLIGEKKALLIDTGMAFGNIRLNVEALTDKPIIVANSHSHYDHVSNNYNFDTIYGRDLDFTRKNASGHPKTTWQNAIQPSAVSDNLPPEFDFESYENKGFEIDHYLKDGEIIDLGGRKIEVIYTPGHTPDGMLFFDRERGYLSTGDTFYPSTLWAHRSDADFKDYIESAKKMAELEPHVKYILPGHGEIVANPNFLGKLYEAFLAMRDPNTPYETGEDRRRYQFDGFAALVADPPE